MVNSEEIFRMYVCYCLWTVFLSNAVQRNPRSRHLHSLWPADAVGTAWDAATTTVQFPVILFGGDG